MLNLRLLKMAEGDLSVSLSLAELAWVPFDCRDIPVGVDRRLLSRRGSACSLTWHVYVRLSVTGALTACGVRRGREIDPRRIVSAIRPESKRGRGEGKRYTDGWRTDTPGANRLGNHLTSHAVRHCAAAAASASNSVTYPRRFSNAHRLRRRSPRAQTHRLGVVYSLYQSVQNYMKISRNI